MLDLVAALNGVLKTDLGPEFGPTRAGDVRYSLADVTRTKRDLGYEPEVAFERGLAETVRWHLASA